MANKSAELDGIFEKEVKDLIKSGGHGGDVQTIPLPNEVENWHVSGKEIYIVKNIPDKVQYYNTLNDTVVWQLPKGKKLRARTYSVLNHDFRRDRYGDVIYETAKKPKGTVFVCTNKSLNLPFGFKATDNRFTYIDFEDDEEGNRTYYYTVPKEYVFQIDQLALCISKSGSMKCYQGIPYHTWHYGLVFLYLIPYKANMSYVNKSTVVLYTCYGDDVHALFKDDLENKILTIENYWIQEKIIGNISDYAMKGYDCDYNLIVEDTKYGYNIDDYKGTHTDCVEEDEFDLDE
jgi:hypothetical protein